MGVLVMDCPHDGCSAKHATFTARAFYMVDEGGGGIAHWLLMACPVCHDAVMVKVNLANQHNLVDFPGNISAIPTVAPRETFPQPRPNNAPEFVDANVARTFERANAAIGRGESETAGMLLRKMLDAVISDKFPHTGDGMLGQKMKKLKPNEDLPQAMVDWANEIKEYGNESAHEPHEPSMAEMKELRDFAELLLLYVYTLPGRLAQVKAQATSAAV